MVNRSRIADGAGKYFSFRNFFEISNVGYGATIATILTVIIVLITIVYMRVQTQQQREEGLYG